MIPYSSALGSNCRATILEVSSDRPTFPVAQPSSNKTRLKIHNSTERNSVSLGARAVSMEKAQDERMVEPKVGDVSAVSPEVADVLRRGNAMPWSLKICSGTSWVLRWPL